MGSKTYLSLECFKCKRFSVQGQTKSNRWKCKRCGEKQSIRKVYASSDKASDIRKFNNELNMKVGQALESGVLDDTGCGGEEKQFRENGRIETDDMGDVRGRKDGNSENGDGIDHETKQFWEEYSKKLEAEAPVYTSSDDELIVPAKQATRKRKPRKTKPTKRKKTSNQPIMKDLDVVPSIWSEFMPTED